MGGGVGAGRLPGIELEDVYDEATLARIERRAPRPRPDAEVGRTRRGLATAVVAGAMLGVAEVFDPPKRNEVEEVDPWSGGGVPGQRVLFHWHPHPPRSVAEVRW